MAVWKFNMTPKKVPGVKTRFRRIVTQLPVPESLDVFTQLEQYESRSMHGQMPVVWDKAVDFQVFDKYGNCWIDFTSTIFVANTGHANSKVLAGLQKQIDQKLIHTYTFAHEVRVKFLKKLIEMTPSQFQKAFLLSAGTEATECAIKLMRMHGQTIKPSKIGIISFEGGMHGRTMAAEMLKGNPKTSAWIGYKDPNINSLPVPYPWGKDSNDINYDWASHFERDMQALKDSGVKFDDIGGFIIESYLGWGAIFYPPKYIQALASFAKKHHALVAFDEIQGGFGRTGKLFVYQHYGVEPDLLCLGKAISGGLPLSAVIGRKEIMDLPDIGSMSSTHSANPLSCAAGLANLQYFDETKLVKESARKGKLLHGCLNDLKVSYPERIAYILGQGLLAAMIIKNPKTGEPDTMFANQVCEKAMQKGLLLVHTGRESIKIGPPLTISNEALLEGMDVLAECFAEVTEEKAT